jgi:hypothetical protein
MASIATSGRDRTSRSPRHVDTGFMIEVLALLAMLLVCIAVLMQLLAASDARSKAGASLSQAVGMATSVAEEFSASPTTVSPVTSDGDLSASCDVTSERTGAGLLYHATITVTDADGAQVYTLQTARYVGGES